MKHAATIVAALNISSTTATCKDFQGKETVKWEGGDSVHEGSLDPSDNSQSHEEPPNGGS